MCGGQLGAILVIHGGFRTVVSSFKIWLYPKCTVLVRTNTSQYSNTNNLLMCTLTSLIFNMTLSALVSRLGYQSDCLCLSEGALGPSNKVYRYKFIGSPV